MGLFKNMKESMGQASEAMQQAQQTSGGMSGLDLKGDWPTGARSRARATSRTGS